MRESKTGDSEDDWSAGEVREMGVEKRGEMIWTEGKGRDVWGI